MNILLLLGYKDNLKAANLLTYLALAPDTRLNEVSFAP